MEFSDEFLQDIIKLFVECVDNEDDDVNLSFDIDGEKLNVYIKFSID